MNCMYVVILVIWAPVTYSVLRVDSPLNASESTEMIWLLLRSLQIHTRVQVGNDKEMDTFMHRYS